MRRALRVDGACNMTVDDNFSLSDHCDGQLAQFLRPLIVSSCQHDFAHAAHFGRWVRQCNKWRYSFKSFSSTWAMPSRVSRLMAHTAAIVEKTEEGVVEIASTFWDPLRVPEGMMKPNLAVQFTCFMETTPAELLFRGTGH